MDPYTRDVGRMGESDNFEDMYKFKTPSLRNVSLTFPYGHNGAYPTLKGIVKHHLNPYKCIRIGSQVWLICQKLNGWKKLILLFFGRKGTKKTSFQN